MDDEVHAVSADQIHMMELSLLTPLLVTSTASMKSSRTYSRS